MDGIDLKAEKSLLQLQLLTQKLKLEQMKKDVGDVETTINKLTGAIEVIQSLHDVSEQKKAAQQLPPATTESKPE